MKMVMEKSWNMKHWPKVIEFHDSVMESFLPILPPFCTKFVFLLSPLRNSTKLREFKIGERNGHGKSRNGHGKSWKNILSSLWEPCLTYTRNE